MLAARSTGEIGARVLVESYRGCPILHIKCKKGNVFVPKIHARGQRTISSGGKRTRKRITYSLGERRSLAEAEAAVDMYWSLRRRFCNNEILDSVASVSTASSWKNYNIRSTQELVETVIKTAIDTDLDGAAALFNIDV